MAGSQTSVDERKSTRIPDILARHEAAILEDWIRRQLAATSRRADLVDERTLRAQSAQFLRALRTGLQGGSLDSTTASWGEARALIAEVSATRARTGFSPRETATFVFSLKEPVFARLSEDLKKDPEALASEVWNMTTLIDGLGLLTAELYAQSREEVIVRQQRELLELSTPVVTLWNDILALPLIGTLDSARTQVVMESLLQRIVDTGSRIAILDITGVPTVDTLVAQHLLKTVAAARLMGADCLISGIRPQIAQTIVHLGVDLGHITTKATLREAFAIALERTNQRVVTDAPTELRPQAEGRDHMRAQRHGGMGNGN